MSSCLPNRKTRPLVLQEDMASCWTTTRHVFLFNEKTCLLAEQEHMSQEDLLSRWTRGHVFLLNKGTFLFRLTFKISRLARSPDFPITLKFWLTGWSCLAISGLGVFFRFPDNMFPITSWLLTSGQHPSYQRCSAYLTQWLLCERSLARDSCPGRATGALR